MADKITRRRAFGIFGALAALATIPPAAALASGGAIEPPVPHLVGESGPETIVPNAYLVSSSASQAAWKQMTTVGGEPITANKIVNNAVTTAKLAGGVKAGEMTFSLRVDTSELDAALAKAERLTALTVPPNTIAFLQPGAPMPDGWARAHEVEDVYVRGRELAIRRQRQD